MSFIRRLIKYLTLAFIALFIPFLTERVIMNGGILYFKIPFRFSKETWFAFYGSYFGAVATIVLSYIALRQNKEYKLLSDQSAEAYYRLQSQVKDLTADMMNALDVLKRIEVSKYWPALVLQPLHACNIPRDRVQNDIQKHGWALQATALDHYEPVVDHLQLFDKHRSSYAVLLKNIGEKTIRNLICRKVKINGQFKTNMLSFATDVDPGQPVLVVIINVPECPTKDQTIHVEVGLCMQNLVGERFTCVLEMLVHRFDEAPFIYATLTPAELCSWREDVEDEGECAFCLTHEVFRA